MEILSIKDIHAGLLDARSELQFNKFEAFEKYYVVPNNFNLDDLLKSPKCFISGFKGTGKTALLYYITNQIKNVDKSSIVSFIYFKDFDSSDKDKIQTIANNINVNSLESDITIKNNQLLKIDGYIYIWKWVILEQILKDNESLENSPFKKDSNYFAFRKKLNQIRFNRLNKKKFMFPTKVDISCNIKTSPDGTTTYQPNLSLEFNTQKINKRAYDEFKDIIDEAFILFCNLQKTAIPYYIMLDELEAFYSDKDIFIRDLQMLRDLLYVVKLFNLESIESNIKKFKIICSIRKEILNSIYLHIPSYELNKVTHGFEIPLKWSHNNNGLEHPIFQMLLKRIRYTEELKLGINRSDESIYESWFPLTINQVSTFEKILNETWNKPRDIVRFLISVQNSHSSNLTKFNDKVFSDSFEEYSKESLNEVIEELNALYNKEEISEIISWFYGFASLFSKEQLEIRLNTHFTKSKLKDRLENILKDLYRIGVLGNHSSITKEIFWYHRGNENMVIGDGWQYHIHRGLFKALAINTKMNYRQHLFTTRRTIKLNECFEVSVVEIDKKFLKITFTDNYKKYFGIIPISEISNDFINYQFLIDKFFIGMKFYAKIINFNEISKTWIFSKKEYDNESGLRDIYNN